MVKNILYIAIFTTVLVISWVGFSIYDNFATSTIPTDTSTQIVPIDSHFDTTVLDSLSKRTMVEVDLGEAPPTATGSVSSKNIRPTITPSVPQQRSVISPSQSVNTTPTVDQTGL